MKKIIIGAIAALAFGTVSAAAADLPVRPPVYKAPPPIAVAYSWTGFYVGAHGGAVWMDKDWDVPATALNLAGGCAGCPRPAGSHSDTSWLGGVQAGFNWQMGQWVWGAEVQASWTDLHGSSVSLFIPPSTINSKTDNLGTIAARFGMAWDRTLFFVKGGGAWAHDKFFTTLIAAPTIAAQSTDSDRWGWMVGVGLEYAFTQNWSIKVEYDHLDFGTNRETLQPLAACVGCAAFNYDIGQTIDLVKVGVNYHFGGPVVTRY